MNNKNKKLINFLSIISILGIIFLLFTYFYEIYRTRDYIKTNAIITSNIEETDYGLTDNSSPTKYKYVEIKYGNYTNKYRVLTFLFKKEGNSTTIFYSKENPNLIRDKFKMSISLLISIFLILWVVGLNLSIHLKRTEKF